MDVGTPFAALDPQELAPTARRAQELEAFGSAQVSASPIKVPFKFATPEKGGSQMELPLRIRVCLAVFACLQKRNRSFEVVLWGLETLPSNRSERYRLEAVS